MGLIFTPKLSWSRSQRKLACQATKSIVCIRNYQKQYGYFHFHECFKLFDSMVKPILLYGSERWGFKFSPIIERVQTHYCKLFLGVSRSTNTDMVLGECGRLPLYVDYVSRFIKYWCRILQMSSNRYPKQTYIMLYDLDSVGRHTWASEVRIILCKYGFGFLKTSETLIVLYIVLGLEYQIALNKTGEIILTLLLDVITINILNLYWRLKNIY